jgi:hypothetical protein
MDGFWVVEMKCLARGPRLGPYVHTTDVKKEELERMRKKEREGICGDGSQRSEPNLPLSEANLKIVEGEIPGISDACTMGLPMTRDRKFARAGQTHKKWKADSASMENAPQVGLGLSPLCRDDYSDNNAR